MELKQNPIHRNYKKTEARSQITIGDDYSVPEGKSDVAEILQKKGELLINEVHTEKGKIRIQGTLKLSILYLTERASKAVDGLTAEIPFDEILYMEGAASGDNLKIDWDMEELRVTVIHPGKLGIRGIVSLWGMITGTETSYVTENVDGISDIQKNMGSFVMAEPAVEKNESFRIRDEVNLPVNKPNVGSVLWKDLQLRGLEIRMQEGRLSIKGEVLFFVVYEGEEEGSGIQWMEQSLPFHGNVDVPGMTPEMFGLLEPEISHQEMELKPDYDGEMRSFLWELVLEIHMHVYEERTCPLLTDAYSVSKNLKLQPQEAAYERLRMCNQTRCRVNGQEQLTSDLRVLQILGHQARIFGKKQKATDQGILCEGTLEVQILYITASDSQPLGCAAVQIPYSQLIEIPEMQKEDLWKVWEMPEQVLISMPEGSRIEVRATIQLNACVMELCHVNHAAEVTAEDYDPEMMKKRPGILVHFVQPKETLWEIAKNNFTTVEEIKKRNDLSADEVLPGQKLLITKGVSGELPG